MRFEKPRRTVDVDFNKLNPALFPPIISRSQHRGGILWIYILGSEGGAAGGVRLLSPPFYTYSDSGIHGNWVLIQCFC